jgi:hypothetical protein
MITILLGSDANKTQVKYKVCFLTGVFICAVIAACLLCGPTWESTLIICAVLSPCFSLLAILIYCLFKDDLYQGCKDRIKLCCGRGRVATDPNPPIEESEGAGGSVAVSLSDSPMVHSNSGHMVQESTIREI